MLNHYFNRKSNNTYFLYNGEDVVSFEGILLVNDGDIVAFDGISYHNIAGLSINHLCNLTEVDINEVNDFVEGFNCDIECYHNIYKSKHNVKPRSMSDFILPTELSQMIRDF